MFLHRNLHCINDTWIHLLMFYSFFSNFRIINSPISLRFDIGQKQRVRSFGCFSKYTTAKLNAITQYLIPTNEINPYLLLAHYFQVYRSNT